MKIDEANKIIYVRQSWLGDMAICPERGRLGATKPEFRSGSDATIIGTAIHHGIESVLNGHSTTLGAMMAATAGEYERLNLLGTHKITNIIQEEIPDYLNGMSTAWYEEIQPQVKPGGKVEHFFRVPLGVNVGGYDIHLEGTMDYMDDEGIIWDWKTAKKLYSPNEKQKSAIQPTVYTTAMRLSGQAENPRFFYGVMVRQAKPKHQILEVYRNKGHMDWLRHLVRGAVGQCLATGFEQNWIMNDTSPLCSESWCSFWSICKGAYNVG